MAGQENVMIVLPKSEWEQVKNKINRLLEIQKKNSSPLEGYVSKQQILDLYGFSNRTWSRLKSQGLIQVKKLGGLQFVKADDFIAAIESGSL